MTWRLCDTDWNHWPQHLDDDMLWGAAVDQHLDGVELGVYRVADDLNAERIARLDQLTEDSGLPVAAVLLSLPADRWPHGALTGAAEQIAQEVDALAALACRWGLTALGLWPGADPLGSDPQALIAGTRLAAAAAARHKVRLAIEYKPDTAVANSGAAIALAEQVDNVGILLDTGHAYALGEQPEDVVRALAGRGLLTHLHLGDAHLHGGDDDLPVGRLHDVGPTLDALRAVGYSGAASFDLYGAVEAGALTGRAAVAESVRHIRSHPAYRPLA